MLSKAITEKKRIYAICEKSGDIRADAVFHGVRIADPTTFDRIPERSAVICCGSISDSELLFRTEDGRCYFSVCDGWGEEDGVLYGLHTGLFYDFGHPTTVETIFDECEANVGTYTTFVGCMAYHQRKSVLKTISSVMSSEAKKNRGDEYGINGGLI